MLFVSLFSFLSACSYFEVTPQPLRSNQVSPLGIRGEVQDKIDVPELKVSMINYQYTQMPTKVYAAGNNINLRSTASIKASVVSKIPLGNPIRVLKKDKSITIGDRKDHWYHIESKVGGKVYKGYLFGPTMTPGRIVADLDGDGKDEMVLGTFNERKEFLLRIADKNGSPSVLWTNIGQFASNGKVAEQVHLKFYSKKITGVPLLKIEVACIEKCNGMSWSKFINYTSGSLVRVLEYSESESKNGYSVVDLYFNPSKKSIVARRIHGKIDNKGQVKETNQKSIYSFESGKYRLTKGSGVRTAGSDIQKGTPKLEQKPIAKAVPAIKATKKAAPVIKKVAISMKKALPTVKKATVKKIVAPKSTPKKTEDINPRIEPSEG